jgi:hypothetical protein
MIRPLSEQTADRPRGCPRRKLTLDLRDSRHCDGRAVDDPANSAGVLSGSSCNSASHGLCAARSTLINVISRDASFAAFRPRGPVDFVAPRCMIAFALNSIPDAVSPLKRSARYRAAARRRSCPGHARGSCGIAVVLGNRVYRALNFAGEMLKLRVRAEFAVHWLRRGAPAPRGTFLQTATKQMVRAPLRCFDIAPGLRSVLSQVPKPVVSRRFPCVDS